MGKYNVKRKEEFVVIPGRESLPGAARPPASSAVRLLREARPEWRTLSLGTLALFAASAANLAVPALFGRLIDSFSADGGADAAASFNQTVFLLVSVSAVNAFFSFLKSLFFERAGERMVARLRNRVFESLLRQEVGFYDQSRSGGLVSNVQGDSVVIKEACTTNISSAFRNIIQILGGVIYLCSLSWKLTLLLVVVVFPVSLLTRLYSRRIKDVSKRARQALAEAADVAEESFTHIRTVRSFAAESKQQALYEAKTAAALLLGIKAALANGLFSGGTSAVISLSFIGVVFVGGRMVLSGELSTGSLTSFLLYGMQLGGAIASLGGLWGSLASAMGATERIYSLLDRIPLVDRDEGLPVDRSSLRGGITFENVTFEYPARKGETVLKGVSFHIPAGSTCAFVGASGGGKSSIVSLIEKYYSPSSGRILVDGRDLNDLSGSSLRRNIGLVLQDCALFAATLRENIAFGVPEGEQEATMEEVIEAAKAANAYSFIMGFKDGFDTPVGERGQRLSGGQRQRVAIARCFLIKPKIVILDEATSALDANSEHEVQAALNKLIAKGAGSNGSDGGSRGEGEREGQTVIIVAHRLSAVRGADIIFVLDQGRVVAQGRHEELLDRSPVYAELVKKQLAAASTLATGTPDSVNGDVVLSPSTSSPADSDSVAISIRPGNRDASFGLPAGTSSRLGGGRGTAAVAEDAITPDAARNEDEGEDTLLLGESTR